MRNKKLNKNTGVQLITYADSLGNNLTDLKYVLDNYFQDAIKGVHILPFYPSSADRGFAPLTHRQIDARFGSFDDLRAISADYELMADKIVKAKVENIIAALGFSWGDIKTSSKQFRL